MSRDDLTTFIRAITHSSYLREELENCKDKHNVLALAKKYGFNVTTKDLTENKDAERINKQKLSTLPSEEKLFEKTKTEKAIDPARKNETAAKKKPYPQAGPKCPNRPMAKNPNPTASGNKIPILIRK